MRVWLLVATMLLFLSSQGRADDFQFDPSQKLIDLDGKPMLSMAPSPSDPECKNCMPVTMGSVIGSCLAKMQGKGPEYWALAHRIATAAGPTPVSVAEIHAIRECLDGKMPPLFSGQIDPVIDPTYKPEPIK